jgi:hypothetical protein
VGRHAALGFSPFGIDDLKPDNPLAQAYAVLGGMAPFLLKYQAAGKVTALVEGSERDAAFSFAGHSMKVRFGGRGARFAPAPAKATDLPPAPGPDTVALPGGDEKDQRGFALLIASAPDELVIAGSRVAIRFESGGPAAARELIGTVDEGRFEDGEWIAGRRMNGDESFSNSVLFLDGDEVSLLRVKLYRR